MENWQLLRRDKVSERAYPDLKAAKLADEIWINDIYMVFVRKHMLFGENGGTLPPMTWLSIKRHDKEPCNDWRHFQWIKNQLVGDDCEGVQLYPAECRMVDGSNQYHLWVFEDPAPEAAFPFGFFDGRQISEHPMPNGRQRSWPKNMRPPDMDIIQKQLKRHLDEHLDKNKI